MLFLGYLYDDQQSATLREINRFYEEASNLLNALYEDMNGVNRESTVDTQIQLNVSNDDDNFNLNVSNDDDNNNLSLTVDVDVDNNFNLNLSHDDDNNNFLITQPNEDDFISAFSSNLGQRQNNISSFGASSVSTSVSTTISSPHPPELINTYTQTSSSLLPQTRPISFTMNGPRFGVQTNDIAHTGDIVEATASAPAPLSHQRRDAMDGMMSFSAPARLATD